MRCVTAEESVKVPPMEEVIVDAYADRHQNQEGGKENRLLVEMHPNLPEGYSYVLAPSMVDAAIDTLVTVHMFNPHSYPVVIRQDSVVGEIEPVEVVSTILRCENANERENFSAARRVLFREFICPEDLGTFGSSPRMLH